MLKTILKTSVTLTFLAWSGLSCAAGLGGINVTSALGQPLKAEIEITSADKSEKATLRAKLASVDAYKNAGIDYPYGIPKLKFLIEDRENGESVIRVSSAQPINDPFVTLMVELSWASGKLMREYTFLLDPVGYKPEQPKAEEVKPVQPVIAEPVIAPAPVSAPVAQAAMEEQPAAAASAVVPAVAESAVVAESTVAAQSEVAAAPAQSAVAAVPEAEIPAQAEQPIAEQPLAEASAPTAAPVEAAPVSRDALSKEEAMAEAAPEQEHITVKSGDTLTKIAAQIKPANVSLERMLVALYRENAGVFGGHNMNRIRAGKILNIPQRAAVDALPQADAVEEIRAQAADWNAYRQKLAAAKPVEQPPAEKQEVSGKISAAVTDKAVPAKEPAKEVLKLSKGEAPGDKAVGGGKASAQEKAIAKEEEAIATGKALKETQERTAILEKNVQDLKQLAEVKKESAPAVAASAATGAVALSAASAPQAASGAAVVQPKPKPKPKMMPPPQVVESPSLVDQLLGNPLYLAGGAAALLALGGAGFMVVRRRKGGAGKKKEAPAAVKEEDVGSTTGRMTAPVAPSPETGDFTHAAAQAAPAPEAEEVDPIGEADLFLTFGRDVQAEEVLKEALKKNPNNIPVKLKLLSIYSNRKDSNSFYTYAKEIKESGDEAAWEQAMTMGRALDPSNPFYGGTAGAAAATETVSEAAAPGVDFDLGFGAAAAPEYGGQNTVVMETPSQEKTTIMSPEELRTAAQQATTMDFDITGTNPSLASLNMTGGRPQEEAPALNMDDLVFDVTTTHPKVSLPPEPAAEAPAAGGLEFTLDFPLESKPAAPAKAAPDLGLSDISLDLGGIGAGGAEPKGAQWQEVATKLDLAKAYQEMGDVAGAREILEEVLRDGDEQQRATAQTLMQQL